MKQSVPCFFLIIVGLRSKMNFNEKHYLVPKLNTMKLCELCKKNEADKTGSHIIPHFLLKRVDNLDGSDKRDLEFGFRIGNGNVKGYFGRSIQPEKLEETYGEVTDELIAGSRSEMIVDFLLCSDCEKKLAEIEHSYSPSIEKFEKTTFKSNDDPQLSTLFWASVFWRASVSGTLAIKLSDEHEELLRIFLNNGLKTEESEADFTGIKYRLLKIEGYQEDRDGFVNFGHNQTNPYYAAIGDQVIKMTFDQDAEKQKVAFFGFEDAMNDAPLNNVENGEQSMPVNHEMLEHAIAEFTMMLAEDFMEVLDNDLDELHVFLGGNGKMDDELKSAIKKNIEQDEIPLGHRYSPEGKTIAIIKAMQDLGVIPKE
ncbi:hypothetical protein FA048_12835 [Pedobacter polaris]|uniref:HNH endonuclease n=1 Tax=Pedobacter polaris TaxID=2571273 RepID=A0A4U1CN01_9SPHI|nr:hypothetical protein [Pedobacter polaris]TKC08043.1 hypothetical protein FA048_12835 [Pedobacter polaris]